MNLSLYFTPYASVNSKCFRDLNMKPKTVKLPEENVGENLCDL